MKKTRYETHLAMEKSRYEIVLHVVYICAIFASLPFSLIGVRYISPHTCFAVSFRAMCVYMFNKASVNVSCLGGPDLQLPRHAIELEVWPPLHRALPQEVGQIKSVMSAAPPGQPELQAPDQKGC